MESCAHQHIDKIVSENTPNTSKVLNTAEQPHRARNSPCSRELIYSGERRKYWQLHPKMEERISTFTLSNGRENIYSHSPGGGEDCVRRSITWSFQTSRTVSETRCVYWVLMATENLQIEKVWVFPVQKGHPLGTARTLGLQFKKNSGNEGKCRNQAMISLITALRAWFLFLREH